MQRGESEGDKASDRGEQNLQLAGGGSCAATVSMFRYISRRRSAARALWHRMEVEGAGAVEAREEPREPRGAQAPAAETPPAGAQTARPSRVHRGQGPKYLYTARAPCLGVLVARQQGSPWRD
jgi:hypothetical protein